MITTHQQMGAGLKLWTIHLAKTLDSSPGLKLIILPAAIHLAKAYYPTGGNSPSRNIFLNLQHLFSDNAGSNSTSRPPPTWLG